MARLFVGKTPKPSLPRLNLKSSIKDRYQLAPLNRILSKQLQTRPLSLTLELVTYFSFKL